MTSAAIDNPVLNSPFRRPERHYALDDNGAPTGEMRSWTANGPSRF